MGMNGFQYINDSNGCMMCDETCSSSTCDEGPRTLPWTQDYGNDIWDEGETFIDEGEGNGEYDDGEEFTDTGVVWDMWDITLRDFVILDRNGRYVTRINLTSTNPDPNSTCGENYDTIKELLISIRNQ